MSAILIIAAFTTLNAAPLAAAEEQHQMTVSATSGWQGRGIWLRAGDVVRTSARGSATVDYRNLPRVGPDGYDYGTDREIWGGNAACKTVRHVPYGILLAKVADQVDPVGAQGLFTVIRDGFLEFSLNDLASCLGDNMGEFQVDVRVSSYQ